MTKDQASKREAALEMLREAYQDKELKINGNAYKLPASMTHAKRLSIYAFYTQRQPEIAAGNHSFMGTKEWEKMESELFRMITFEDMTLDKRKHFEDPKYEKDYILLMISSMGALTYPFLPESVTD